MRATAVGSTNLDSDETLAPARELSASYKFERRSRPRARMFLRAEDVLRFRRRTAGLISDLQELRGHFQHTFASKTMAQRLAVGSVQKELSPLTTRYGPDPHTRSHGETFSDLLRTRLVPGGLYFLDEPETPLSPTRVLALLTLLHDRTRAGCQFVIATLSPMLLAYPTAEILRIENGVLCATNYRDLDHYKLTRDFLNDPNRYLRRLFCEEE